MLKKIIPSNIVISRDIYRTLTLRGWVKNFQHISSLNHLITMVQCIAHVKLGYGEISIFVLSFPEVK